MEVYLGGRWHAFDPRNNAPRIGRILIASGPGAVIAGGFLEAGCDPAELLEFGEAALNVLCKSTRHGDHFVEVSNPVRRSKT